MARIIRAMTVVAILTAGAAYPRRSPGDPPSSGPVLAFLEPGTIVDTTAPAGWTHLVLKSIPKLASGDLDTLPSSAARTATLFRTAFLAEVGRDPNGRHALRRVGLGLCVPHGGHDVVVTASSLKRLKVDLGTLDGLVLAAAEKVLKQARVVAASTTFVLIEAPALRAESGRHRAITLRYAFTVDRETGVLRTFVWERPEASKPSGGPLRPIELTPGLVYTCGLDVVATRVFGSLPVAWSFAMNDLPPGEERTMDPSFAAWAARTPATDSQVAAMEEAIRQGAR